MDDMPSDFAIAGAISWIQNALLGSVATAVATIAIASIGYLAFSGRVDLRRALQIILGCFILFGAPTIATGLQNLAAELIGPTEPPVTAALLESAPLPELPKKADDRRPVYDPYAGAALAPN